VLGLKTTRRLAHSIDHRLARSIILHPDQKKARRPDPTKDRPQVHSIILLPGLSTSHLRDQWTFLRPAPLKPRHLDLLTFLPWDQSIGHLQVLSFYFYSTSLSFCCC
jgi:hypothetical protein